jgi:hypothetical protein
LSLAAQFLEQQLPSLGLGSPLKQPHTLLSVQLLEKAQGPPVASTAASGYSTSNPNTSGQGSALRPGHSGDRFERPLFGESTLESFAMPSNPIGENTMMALDLNMSESTLMGLTEGFMLKSLPAQDHFQPNVNGDAATNDEDVNENGKRSAPPSFSGRFGKKAKTNIMP